MNAELNDPALDLGPRTRVSELLGRYPFLLDFLAGYTPEFAKLRNPIVRNTLGRVATLELAASMGSVPLDRLIQDIGVTIREHLSAAEEVGCGTCTACPAGQGVVEGVGYGDGFGGGFDQDYTEQDRKAVLKGLINDLHAGVPLEQVKQRFAAELGDVDASEIAAMEQALIADGLSPEAIRPMCDVHVGVFRDSLDRQAVAALPDGHALTALRAENRTLEEAVAAARALLDEPVDPQALDTALALLLRAADRHYLRKEHQIFPYLERHEINGPPQVMWGIHDDIRASLRKAREALAAGDAATCARDAGSACTAITEMVYKEENILFPLTLEVLGPEEWTSIAANQAEIDGPTAAAPAPVVTTPPADTGALPLDTGVLTAEQLNLLLNTLPVDITFVDEHDRVRYYSRGTDRIFPRMPEIIGRQVQMCHPPKSLHVVDRILDEFRAGKRDHADFWIQLRGRFVHIRYFAVRDAQKRYRGTLEVSQDITDIQKLEGQRRLLDWTD